MRDCRRTPLLFALGFACLFVLASGAAADDTDDEKPPWFTGPLLVPGAEVIGRGTLLLQPYLYGGEGLGIYNNGLSARHTAVETTINPQLLLGYGITDDFDVQLDLQTMWNNDNGAGDFGIGDTQLELHYAVAEDGDGGWLPAIRVDYVQIFPTGEYERLDPAKNGTDGRGSGVFASSLGINFMKTFHLGGEHFLRPDLSVIYSIPLADTVHGLNVYGGGAGTDGTIHPGNAVTAYFSGELSLTRRWAVGFDSTYSYVDAARFTGNPGVNPDGTPAEVGFFSSYQITLSPQLEYNFDSKQGLVAGPWFTLVGRNSDDFFSFVVSYAAEFDLPTPW